MASYDINGRTVFITGAARGIGAGIARALHARGANVALVGLEPERLEALAAELGDRVACFEADVCDLNALERAAAGTLQRFGSLDVGIANAGIHSSGALATAPIERVERTLEVNLMGVWRTDRAILRHIVERRGYLLNIASMSAIANAPLMGPYSASKAGVEALTNCLRMETSVTGARVGLAYFGFIQTDLVSGAFELPSSRVLMGAMPGFVRKPKPLPVAIKAIERGIERRAGRIYAPAYVRGAYLIRGVMQPLTERRIMRDPRLAEALRLADPDTGADPEPDLLLGVGAPGE